MPRIFKPDLHSLFCTTNIGVVKEKVVLKSAIPDYMIYENGTWREVDLKNCFQRTFNIYYCNFHLQMNWNFCLNNMSLCSQLYKKFSFPEYSIGNFGYLVTSVDECVVLVKGIAKEILNNTEGFYYIPFKKNGAVQCGELVLPIEEREFTIKYEFQEQIKYLNFTTNSYIPSQWTDERNLLDLIKTTESRALPNDWIRFNNFSFIDLIFIILIGFSIIISLLALILSFCIMGTIKSNRINNMPSGNAPIKINIARKSQTIWRCR